MLDEPKIRYAVETAAIVLEDIADRFEAARRPQEGLSAWLDDMKEAIEGVSEALETLADGDVDEATEQIEAVAGALDPKLLEDDSADKAHAVPKE